MALRGAARSSIPGPGKGCPDRPGRLGRLYPPQPAVAGRCMACPVRLLEEQYLCTNDAIMMYSPLLSAAPADGE